METKACCTHLRVALKHEDYPGGFRSDYLECESGCGMKFYPEHVDQQIRNLRDWFAGMALQGMLSADYSDAISNPFKAAHWAYQNADAMLAERAKQSPCQPTQTEG